MLYKMFQGTMWSEAHFFDVIRAINCMSVCVRARACSVMPVQMLILHTMHRQNAIFFQLNEKALSAKTHASHATGYEMRLCVHVLVNAYSV